VNKEQVSSYFSALGKIGGKRKWEKLSKKELSALGRNMALSMHKKNGHKLSTSVHNGLAK
jgi:hypothetical protein